jgi:hypothetical protein
MLLTEAQSYADAIIKDKFGHSDEVVEETAADDPVVETQFDSLPVAVQLKRVRSEAETRARRLGASLSEIQRRI